MSTLQEISNFDTSNLFNALEMSIFAKVAEDGDEEVNSIFDVDGLVLPEGYEHIGLTTKSDGATWTRDTSNSDTTSHGFGQPTRRNITSDISGLTVTAQESKKIVMELFWSQAIAARATDNGGIYWDKANRPTPRRVRLLGIAKDGEGDNAVYCGRWLPSALLSEGSEQTWSEENNTNYPLNFTAFNDSTFGTAFREIWGGPGFDPVARGFETAGDGSGGV